MIKDSFLLHLLRTFLWKVASNNLLICRNVFVELQVDAGRPELRTFHMNQIFSESFIRPDQTPGL